MAKETKVGLLIGLALILLVGIILSDLVSGPAPGVAGQQQATDFGAQAQNDIYAPPGGSPAARHPRSLDRPTVVESAVPDAFLTQPAYGQRPADPRGTSANHPPLILPHPGIEADRGSAPQPIAPSPQRRHDLPEPNTREATGPRTGDLLQALRVDRSAVAANVTNATPPPSVPAQAVAPAATPAPAFAPTPTPAPALSATPEDGSFFIPPPPRRTPDTAAAAAADRGSDRFHVVGPRDSLTAVARKHYGDPAFATGLAQANPGLVGFGGILRPGDRLVLPPLDSPVFADQPVAAAPAHAPAPEPLPPAGAPRAADDAAAGTITVAANDTLSGLAARHLGSSQRWDDLLDANADVLRRPEALRAGMVLRLPAAPAAGSPAAAPNAAAARPAATTYTVKSGDNLTRIAARTLGDGQRWDDVFAANRDQLDRPESLRAGMVLKLPAARPASAAQPSTPAAASAPTRSAKTYTVKAGDNLTRIAARVLGDGQRWDDIFNANRDQLDAPESIRVGQVLILP